MSSDLCDFESGVCDYTLGPGALIATTIQSAVQDHTTGNDNGHFIEISQKNQGNFMGSVMSRPYKAINGKPVCLSYWYHADVAFSSPSLTLNIVQAGSMDLITIKENNPYWRDEWNYAAHTIKPKHDFTVSFLFFPFD